jgi:NADP-reducing hydrogenase subunit HndC
VVIVDGGEWFSSIGTEKSKGTKVFALAGKVVNTGLIEVPMGTTLREIIYDIGGGVPNGKSLKAIQTGGPSGGCLPANTLDTSVDYESLAEAGSIMGSGGMIVIDEDSCMVDMAKFFLEFTQNESCGKCTPCREGTKRMYEILTRITEGKGCEGDIDKLERLGDMVQKSSLCGLGQSAPNPVLSTLKNFREEYEEHIRDRSCRAKVCTSLIAYEINDSCVGCGACKRACPVNVVSGRTKQKHTIDQAQCVRCGICLTTCKFNAIDKV